jgi:hypothetical protein
MAFPAIGQYNGGVCPQSHPVAIYSVFYEFYYDTSPYPDYLNWVYAMGDPTGYGLHGDFLNGWTDQIALADAITTCTGPDGPSGAGCTIAVCLRISYFAFPPVLRVHSFTCPFISQIWHLTSNSERTVANTSIIIGR